jgi:hypothetical protein
MGIRTNLLVSLDEDTVSGDTSVINLKTTDAGNIVIECSVPKVAIKLNDLEDAVKELRSFFITQKHIDVVANSSHVADTTQLNFTYGDVAE